MPLIFFYYIHNFASYNYYSLLTESFEWMKFVSSYVLNGFQNPLFKLLYNIVWPFVLFGTILFGEPHSPHRKVISYVESRRNKPSLEAYPTKLMLLSSYKLYACWNYIIACTGFDQILSVTSSTTYVKITGCLTSPYSYTPQNVRKPSDGYIMSIFVLAVTILIFLGHLLMGIGKIMILYYFINIYGTDPSEQPTGNVGGDG